MLVDDDVTRRMQSCGRVPRLAPPTIECARSLAEKVPDNRFRRKALVLARAAGPHPKILRLSETRKHIGMGTGRAELFVGVHRTLDPVASECVILASGTLANDLEPESLKFGERLRLSEAVEELLRGEGAAIGKMPQSCCDGGLRGIGLILAVIADPDLWAGKATTGEERLQAKLIALLHRRLDFLAGEAVDQCLVFGLVGHIGLFGKEGMV